MSVELRHQMIKVVMLDAVGTMIYPAESIPDSYCRVVAHHTGHQLNPSDVATTVHEALKRRSNCNAEGEYSSSEQEEYTFWQNLIEAICPVASQTKACFDDLFTYFASPDAWRCYDDVGPLLELLRQKGVRIAIGSNFDRRLHAVCNGQPSMAALQDRIISSEIGWRKPASRFYSSAATAFQCQPDEILMVGDDFENDVAGAIHAGCQAVWLNRKRQPIPQLFRPSETHGVPGQWPILQIGTLLDLPSLIDLRERSEHQNCR